MLATALLYSMNLLRERELHAVKYLTEKILVCSTMGDKASQFSRYAVMTNVCSRESSLVP